MTVKLATLASLLTLSLSVLATPLGKQSRAVTPLTMGNGQVCRYDSECSSNYCRQTPAQRAAGSPTGTCDAKKANGNVCYADSGCMSGHCVSGKCGALAPSQPQITCTKMTATTMYLGRLDADVYSALGQPPAQPYLTFNKHYDGANHEVLTTSGPSHRIPAEFWKCTSQSMRYENGNGYSYGQIRLPSVGPQQCLTALYYGYYGGTSPLFAAPCVFDDQQYSIGPQYFAVGTGASSSSTKKKRGLSNMGSNPYPYNDHSAPFVQPVVPKGSSDPHFGQNAKGFASPSQDGKYSSWLLDNPSSQNDSPLYLVSGYTR
ncbi:hypothetical protein K437DRAFT_260635 [Tilletiaria anomala UBC 951]|uniref:Lytic polysaccharide monooxygenase n=1 Tax=Tilletiaria anomala (strain ATCC 24038 / CBS 436.72 / UBC 951) TaxID=1037660 RepID=A0A066WR05_TILAU|nr:uncharacterized protein K437DRAFT_260635 [Tilletiaria anomala UBC 951]KDN53424.1 hypothetical protein K437DRAFT_260635 [Tilletiaria anomala UBC 951]